MRTEARHIVVAGAGGNTGSHLMPHLARMSGVERITAVERACVREAEGGPAGVSTADMNAAISDFFIAAPRALTPRNARNYLRDLPQDVDVVRVNIVERKVSHPHRYRVEAA